MAADNGILALSLGTVFEGSLSPWPTSGKREYRWLAFLLKVKLDYIVRKHEHLERYGLFNLAFLN